MADTRSVKWRGILIFATVVLSCIEATKMADKENTPFSREPASALKTRTGIRNQYGEASRQSKMILHKLPGRARQHRLSSLLKMSHEHQAVKQNSQNKLGKDPKIHGELHQKGNKTHLSRYRLGNRIVRARVRYGTILYKKTLPDDDVDIDDQPRIVLPPDDSPKTPETKHKPGGTRSVANGALPPTPMIPTAPPLPVTEEVTSQPTISSATTKAQPVAKPPMKPTKVTTKTTITNIVPPPNQMPLPNTTNIQLNLEIRDDKPSKTDEVIPTTPNPRQILIVTHAPSPPPPQIIIAQPPPTAPPPPPPQPIIINQAPTPPSPKIVVAPPLPTAPPPPLLQPIIIQAPIAPAAPQPLIIHDASDLHPEPIVIAAPSPPSHPSVILSPYDERPSRHTVLVVAPPPSSVTDASQLDYPGGTIDLMGLPSVQSPGSSLLTGQVPLQTQMYPMGYPVGMQLTPQSPFTFLPSPLMPSPLSPFIPPFPSAVGLGSAMYDPQLLMSLTNLFSGALQTTLTQSQPNVLTSALVQAAIQAQTRNQPPDVLTAALTQALAQRMSPNYGQTDTARLIQALTTALSQVQSQRPLPLQPLPLPPAPAVAPLPAVSPLPVAVPPPAPLPAQGTSTYQVLPVQPVATPSMDSTGSDRQSLSDVGKALANALVRAARNLARQKRIHNRDGVRDAHRPLRAFYPRSYASMMPRSFYPHSYNHHLDSTTERSPITRRSKIERWYTRPKSSAFSFQPNCGCCFCC